MNKKEIYSGEYDGITFELVLWGNVDNLGLDFNWTDYSPTWNLYLYLFIDRIPEKYDPKSFLLEQKEISIFPTRIYKSYDYYSHPILRNIDFHGGMTYYEITSDNSIKVGCDYAHYGDNPSDFSFEYLFEDAKNVIASFKEMIPDYKC